MFSFIFQQNINLVPFLIWAPLASFSFCLSSSRCSLETLEVIPRAPVTRRRAVIAVVSGRGLYGCRNSEKIKITFNPYDTNRIHLEYLCGIRKSDTRSEYFGYGHGLLGPIIFITKGQISLFHMDWLMIDYFTVFISQQTWNQCFHFKPESNFKYRKEISDIIIRFWLWPQRDVRSIFLP